MSRFSRKLFAERLKGLVDATKLPLKDVAANIGISTHMLERFIRGESLPTATTLCKICDYLHVRADYLLALREYKV